MNEETREKIYTVITVVVVLLVLAVGVVKIVPRYNQYKSLKKQVADRDALIAEKERKVDELGDMQRRFKTDREFVESIARQDRRVYPGELVFVFDDDKAK